jgi:diguanylate cyclase (GGDEF)-like protein
MDKVLLVEDSRFFGRVLKNKIQNQLNLKVQWYESFKETVEELETGGDSYFVALLDLKLPDALDGEIVDLVQSHSIPSIVFTGDFSDNLRDVMWSKHVVDYVLKEGHHNFDYILNLIRRIKKNRSVKVMVVDDSDFFRKQLMRILSVHQFQLFEASSGRKALKILDQHPDMRLVLTDYNMPDMNGAELTKRIRSKSRAHELAIIGLSVHGDYLLSARFIKNGANDFIHKPFINEELYCRISQNLDLLDYVTEIQDSANTDHLTGLFNRRFFLETAKKLFALSKRDAVNCSVAMVDIDGFKIINDTHGHDAGDVVLQHVARLIRERFREADVVSRFGGEEFCILTPGMHPDKVMETFEGVRLAIEKMKVHINKETLRTSVSIGVCGRTGDTLEDMIKNADGLLYRAKAKGRNRVVVSDNPLV